MKTEKINKFINHCNKAKELGLSYSEYEKQNYVHKNYFGSMVYNMKKVEPTELIIEALSLYNNNKRNNREQLDTVDTSETGYNREDGKIVSYYYTIYRKNKAPLNGVLDRNEMNTIHRLYSYYGDSLTQRIISRQFPELSLVDFKRILRAFNITKASAPFAPHMFEEHTEEELREIQLREKENSFLRKAEEDVIKNNEKLLKKYAQENIELKKQLETFKLDISGIRDHIFEINSFKINTSNKNNSDVIIFLSDLHIGAFNEKFGYIDLENYDKTEISNRLHKVFVYLSKYKFNSITVCNLGDSVDSYNKQTTRGGHELPSTISNKEQSILYQEIMLEFFNKLVTISEEVKYVCVGESNHDGDWGWINNLLLSEKLSKIFGISTYISNNPIDKFDINDTSVIYLHGKDNKNQFKGFPLTLDFKTETWFNNYFLDSSNTFKSKKCIVKGDLHQYAITCAKHFDYISAPSLYGSSNWITANFGKTPWGVLVMEIDTDNNIKNTVISN